MVSGKFCSMPLRHYGDAFCNFPFGCFVLGYFTVATRLASSTKRMLYDMAPGLVAGSIILGILLGQHIVGDSTAALMLTAVIVTNTVYETFLMFLLGYALIEFPREIWNCSNLEGYKLRVEQKAASEFKDIQDAQLSMSLCVSDVLKTNKMITTHSDPAVAAAMAILVAGMLIVVTFVLCNFSFNYII
jgi:hypothetical protein